MVQSTTINKNGRCLFQAQDLQPFFHPSANTQKIEEVAAGCGWIYEKSVADGRSLRLELLLGKMGLLVEVLMNIALEMFVVDNNSCCGTLLEFEEAD
ncbi:hypothetical protein WN944_019172 [Citrus x changshan-huyou]|uniref:Uncharacterized protein n=1 Tax=Citrus x changshan-huyou TaxID=2935761 RepID=A0AAP0QFL5_9ROSI